MIYLDATALKAWSDCREFYRNREIKNIVAAVPNIHYEFGKLVHSAVEEFWKGEPFEKALAVAFDLAALYPVKSINPTDLQTWQRLIEGLPDVLAAYFDSVEYNPENLIWCEREWSLKYSDDVTLCGRLDRLMVGPRLVDVKTASEINRGSTPWKQSYREEKLLDLQFQLYDYWLCKSGTPAIECYLEVILKPYKSKAARYERIDLPEVITSSYRKRFEQQLAWKVSEITHYIKNYSDQKPWPMAGGLACSNKYGECSYAPLCRFGEIPKVTELYQIRQEHLEIRKQ